MDPVIHSSDSTCTMLFLTQHLKVESRWRVRVEEWKFPFAGKQRCGLNAGKVQQSHNRCIILRKVIWIMPNYCAMIAWEEGGKKCPGKQVEKQVGAECQFICLMSVWLLTACTFCLSVCLLLSVHLPACLWYMSANLINQSNLNP